jgi:hypothetical protein
MKTSDYIAQVRALKDIKADTRYYKTLDGEQIDGVYQAHMSALDTEKHLEHARAIVAELLTLIEDSAEGPCIQFERQEEIAGLITLWGLRAPPATDTSE